MGTDYAKALLVAVTMSKVHFDKEMAERRERLTIRYQWFRLSQYHQDVRARYFRRFGKHHKRLVEPVRPDRNDWRSWLWQFGPDNRPISNIHNAAIALRESPALSGIIALDEAGKTIQLLGPLPFAHWESLNFETRRLRDDDLTGLVDYLQSIGLATLSRDEALAAVRLIARENQRGGNHDGR